jgi:hypothetical protein
MYWRSSVWLALLLGGAALAIIGCRDSHSSNSSTPQTGQRNAIVHAAGTIVSVDEQAHDEQSYDLLPGPRVCFTIDSFAELPGAARDVYASAEHQRQIAHGPRCRDTSIDPSAVHIRVGDHVDVYLKLQDAGQISIIRVTSSGVDL